MAGVRARTTEIRAVVAALLSLVPIAGLTNYSLPFYLQVLTARGVPLALASLGTSVMFVVGALASLVVGRLLGRIDPRTALLAGGVLGAASVGTFGQVRGIGLSYLCYAGMGSAFLSLSTLPLTTAVIRLTAPQNRPAALAASTTGISLGGVVAAPLLVAVSARTGPAAATALAAAVILVLVSGAALLLPRSAPPAATMRQKPPTRPPRYLRQPAFWLVGATFTTFLVGQIGALTHLLRLGTEHGLTIASLLIPTVTGTAVLVRFVTAAALRKVGLWRWTVAVLLCQACGLLILAPAVGPAAALVGATLVGVGVGSAPLLMPLTQVDAFGIDDFPRLNARVGLLAAVGQAVGPVILSLMRDLTGNYAPAYVTAALFTVTASVLASITGRFVATHGRTVTERCPDRA
jgi:MFS family permease